MIAPNRVRLLAFLLSVLCVIVGLAILLPMLSRNHFERRAATSSQQPAVEAIQRRGGFVFFKPSNPSSVVSVNLSKVVVDAELLQTLVQFADIERLTFDDGTVQAGDCAELKKLPRLRSLSLARTNVMDEHVAQLPPGLRSLSLNGTGVTDKSMSYVAAMSGLTRLNIAGTDVTSDGLRLLEPLTSLQTLWVDEACITAESAQSLLRMHLQSVDIAVPAGTGERAHELLSDGAGPSIRGRHPDGYTLWEADKAWSETLAGVVEAVVLEIGLDSEQTARLLKALSPTESWKPTKPEPPTPAHTFEFFYPNSPEHGPAMASVDEFLRELQKKRHDANYRAVIRYAREKFTASDVPELLAVMQSNDSRDTLLFWFGPFLLIHHGIDMPEVITELERLLGHKDGFIRATTACAFGNGGAHLIYSREEWVPSKTADAFAVPRLLRMFEDEGEFDQIRGDVWIVLAEIAHRRPEYAAQLLPVLVDVLAEEFVTPTAKGPYLSRIAEVAPDAAVAVLPKLRSTLEHFDRQPPPAPKADLDPRSPHRPNHIATLEALAATASANPAMAQEVAFEYLDRLRDRQPTGPFAPLLSPDNPDVTRRVVLELLDAPEVPAGELAAVVSKIRDWRTAKRSAEN